MRAPNRNTLYARLFVDALANSGLRAVCIAPGSRSTPLTLAFAGHDDITLYSHLDERCASFFALGLAMTLREPVALVCTSGTAAANFYPAIIEANMSQVPLLVLTTDRPHELRHSGANQTIDQVKMYGDHVLWSVDMALPEANPPVVALRNLRATAARAYAKANGLRKGPVHLNFPFRKPLEPTEVEGDVNEDYDVERLESTGLLNRRRIEVGELAPQFGHVDDIEYVLKTFPNGVIVCGPDSGLSAHNAQHLSNKSGYAVVADPISGVRAAQPNIVGWHESLFQHYTPSQPLDVVIRFGRVPTSKWLNQYVVQAAPTHYIHIDESGVWADDSHMVNWQIQADPKSFMAHMDHIGRSATPQGPLTTELLAANARVDAVLQAETQRVFFDGAVVARVVDALPEKAKLFVGNSNAIRHLDQFVPPNEKDIVVYASRGASGIDGQVSTALGVGAPTGERITAILGDITFYHDMNGLLAIRRCGVQATIVVLNNNGGGIFRRLPIANFDPPFTEQFITPHGLTFEHAAAMYGLEYTLVTDFASLDAALEASANSDASYLIEVQTDIETDHQRRIEISALVKEAVKGEMT